MNFLDSTKTILIVCLLSMTSNLIVNAEEDPLCIRQRVAQALMSADGFSDSDLSVLIQALIRQPEDKGRVLSEIARIDSKAARRFLVSEMVQEAQAIDSKNAFSEIEFEDSETVSAVKLVGDKILPELVDVFECVSGCQSKILEFIPEILGKMEISPEKANCAGSRLVLVARNPQRPFIYRMWALRALAQLGADARKYGDDIVALENEMDGALRGSVLSALVGISHPEAVTLILADLESEEFLDRGDLLWNLAMLGPQGRKAGPTVIEFLKSEDHAVLLDAIQSLGWIDYIEAIPLIVPFLDRSDDWRLTYVAALSLGRLRAVSAVEKLEQVSKSHWYAPVRRAASEALNMLRSKQHGLKGNAIGRDLSAMCNDLSEVDGELYQCEGMGTVEINGQRILLNGFSQSTSLKDLPKNFKDPGGVTSVFPISDGWLVGTNRGEFGGELLHVKKKDGGSRVLSNLHVLGIFRLASSVWVVSGISHMCKGYGFIHKIDESGDDLVLKLGFVLPLPPTGARKASESELIVQTNEGTILINSQDEIVPIPCSSSYSIH